MKPCRECGRDVSEQAFACPGCGAPRPARAVFDGYGFEWRSPLKLLGLPLVHVAFKYRPNRVPVVARGWIAVGQFGAGVVTIAQFGVGLVSVSQFTLAWLALAQMAIGGSIVAQLGIFLVSGRGQVVRSLWELLGLG